MENEEINSSFNWQRQFFVTDHIKHKSGFTLYKITSIVFPKQNPEAGTKIVVWKRYNEFKSLHRELKRRCTKSCIIEEFPSLIKSPFFDRFAPFSLEVINKRKKFISLFLNFVAKSPSLFTTDIFVKFFENGYNISEYDAKNSALNVIKSDFDESCNNNSSLIYFCSGNMGQVLNSEESKSSDESSDDIKFVSKSSFPWNNIAVNDSKRKNISTTRECGRSHWKMTVNKSEPSPFNSKVDFRGSSDYWEEAVAHAEEAHEQEMLGQYDVSFAMYKTAIVCLLSGVQGDMDMKRRAQVKELTSKYLQQAEWIYNNYLVFQPKPLTPKLSRIPRCSRSQLQRYKVLSILDNNLLVQDVVDHIFVVIKGVLKSSCPMDKSQVCILPNNMSYLVKLLALYETETTVFFILEYIRYGKLWNHLEHYFTRSSQLENLDTEVTCISPQEKNEVDGNGGGWDKNSVASSHSSGSTNGTNDDSLSRLESSAYTDAMSCESLSSHDENYFDLIEDYARAKSKKLKAIRDFNERRKRVVESIRPVKKTVSQVDLKSMEETSYEPHRSHSLIDLAATATASSLPLPASSSQNFDDEYGSQGGLVHRYNHWHSSGDDDDEDVDNMSTRYRRHSLNDCCEKNTCSELSSVDMDTQQLLRNAQRLIESINETLSKNEMTTDESNNETFSKNEMTNDKLATNPRTDLQTTSSILSEDHPSVGVKSDDGNFDLNHQQTRSFTTVTGVLSQTDITTADNIDSSQLYCCTIEDYNVTDILTPCSESIPSITEEYSITAVIQRNGVSDDMVRKWAAQILITLEGLHANGVICRDLNPNNLLLADNGSIKLTYFYRYPNIDPPLNIEAKEKLYVAPEVDGTDCNVSFASDWWSFGAILYELTTLQTLHSNHPAGINSHTALYIPERICIKIRSLLVELLRYNPNERLGSGISGANDVKAHPYFSDLNWEEI